MSRFHNVFCLIKKKQLEIVFLQGKQMRLQNVQVLAIFQHCYNWLKHIGNFRHLVSGTLSLETL